MVTVLRLVQDVAADVRFLAAEVQMLKQQGAAFVSSPTGLTGLRPGFGLLGLPLETNRVSVDFSGDGKLAAAGVVYGATGVPPQDPRG
jgi:hypothetical protein